MGSGAAARRALVTGACGGIGTAVARRLAADGLAVVAADLDGAAAAALAATLPGTGHAGLACNVADEGSVAAAFAQATGTAGGIDVLVAAAGVLRLRPDGTRPPLAETTLADWEEHHAVNARGTFLCIRAYLRQWLGDARPAAGRVVTFGSVAAQLGGYRSSSAYIGSKGSVMALTKAAAREAAPLGITVNAVAPGLIDTAMLRLSLPEGAEGPVAGAIPLGRIGTPEDVAGAVSFLVGPDAAYLTGGVLDVNGGYRMP